MMDRYDISNIVAGRESGDRRRVRGGKEKKERVVSLWLESNG